MKILLIPFLALILTSCVEYVKIPEDLTKHCAVYEAKEESLDEAIRLARVRKESVDDCNDRMDRIHAIQGSFVLKK